MHNAPPVTYAVGRSAVYGWVLSLVWLAGAGSMGLWCYGVDSVSWRQGLCCLALLVSGSSAYLAWKNSPQGSLHWAASSWVWTGQSSHETQGQVHVRLDWQRGLLLHFVPVQGRGLWLWVSASTQTTRWHSLRRAVYSPARMTTKLTPAALRRDIPNKP